MTGRGKGGKGLGKGGDKKHCKVLRDNIQDDKRIHDLQITIISIMTVRGKGRKGLGKGGAKKHCKVLRDNIQDDKRITLL